MPSNVVATISAIILFALVGCSGSQGVDGGQVGSTALGITIAGQGAADLPPNGFDLWFSSVPASFWERKGEEAATHGFDLHVPQYLPAGYGLLPGPHQISREFDVSLSFVASSKGPGMDILQSRPGDRALSLDDIRGREISISGQPAVVRGGDVAGNITVHFQKNDVEFVIDAYRGLYCDDPCRDFSEAIVIAVAESLVPR